MFCISVLWGVFCAFFCTCKLTPRGKVIQFWRDLVAVGVLQRTGEIKKEYYACSWKEGRDPEESVCYLTSYWSSVKSLEGCYVICLESNFHWQSNRVVQDFHRRLSGDQMLGNFQCHIITSIFQEQIHWVDLRSQEALVNRDFFSLLPMVSVIFILHLHFSCYWECSL